VDEHVERHLGEGARRIAAGLDLLALVVEGVAGHLSDGDPRSGRQYLNDLVARRPDYGVLMEASVDGVQGVVAADGRPVRAAPDDILGEVAVVEIGVTSVEAGLQLFDDARGGGRGRRRGFAPEPQGRASLVCTARR
jgi:hypothetical protein